MTYRSDESDMKAKARQMYVRSNMLRQHFHFCSSDVKNKLFTNTVNNVKRKTASASISTDGVTCITGKSMRSV